MPAGNDPYVSRRGATVLLGAAVLLAAAIVWPRTGMVTRAPVDVAAPSAVTSPGGGPLGRAVIPLPPPAAGSAEAPVIDSIELEKQEVCAGEENLVTVKAHGPGGDDALLHYVVAGRPGARVPVRARRGDTGERPRVIVYGKDGTPTVALVPAYTVKDCDAPHVALVSHRLRANTNAEFEYAVRVSDKPGGPAGKIQPVAFHWTFGDGTTLTSRVAHAVHGYEDRPQERSASTLLTRVEVELASGEKVVGRDVIELPNPAFETFDKKGVVLLVTSLTPRFPSVEADGTVTQTVRVRHTRTTPVSIRQVRVRYLPGDDDGATAEARGQGGEAQDARALLGTNVIEPGRGLDANIRFDAHAHPGMIGVDYELIGTDASGNEARGSFSILTPPPVPDAQNSLAVTDPALTAKIRIAQRLLGKRSVSQDELDQLDREGRFGTAAR